MVEQIRAKLAGWQCRCHLQISGCDCYGATSLLKRAIAGLPLDTKQTEMIKVLLSDALTPPASPTYRKAAK